MGFLDNLLSKSARKLVSDVAKSAVDAVSEEWNKTACSETGSTTYAARAAAPTKPSVPAGYEAYEYAEVMEKVKAVLQKEFSRYEIRENVSPETLGGTGRFLPYTLGVYENGAPKLFIMEVHNNTCASRSYRWSKEEAGKAGVPMINFVYLFENRIDYIINRLHQYL